MDESRRTVSRLEAVAAGVAAVVLLGLAIAEPDVLSAPFQNGRTLLFTFGGTALAVVAWLAMVRGGVPPVARVVVLGVPFVATTWWLVSPFFVDDVVDDEFVTSIAEAGASTTVPSPSAPTTTPPAAGAGTTTSAPPPPTTVPGPRLLGAGSFVGLAGHEGTGDAGFFELEDGSTVLRLERFDIENGPDLRLYVVPGGGQVTPASGSVDLGQLRGNVGDQTYELPPDVAITPGEWTVLVWCEAFSVEFVAATVAVA